MAVTTIAFTGVPLRLTRFRYDEPGMPSSRAKAYHMRPIDVTDARPHSHIAPPIMTAIRFVRSGERLLAMTYSTGYGSAAVAATSPPGMHHVSTISIT